MVKAVKDYILDNPGVLQTKQGAPTIDVNDDTKTINQFAGQAVDKAKQDNAVKLARTAPTTATTTTPTTKTTTSAPWGDGNFMDWWMSEDEKRRAEDEDERKKLKRNQVFAKIGDGLSAMHEAYSKARGVEPMTDGVSMQKKLQDRFDKMKKERDKEHDAYLKRYLDILRQKLADETAARTEQYNRESLELRRRQQNRLDQAEERQRLVAEANAEAIKARAAKDYATATYQETKAYYLGAGYSLKEAESKARVAKLEAQTDKINSSGSSSGSSGGSKSSGKGSGKSTGKGSTSGGSSTGTTTGGRYANTKALGL